MNKLLIVLLAVCLVSVHAFVKRDAPAPENKNYLEDIKKSVESFASDVNKHLTDAFNPEEIKKKFNEVVDGLTKTVNEMKPKQPAAQ